MIPIHHRAIKEINLVAALNKTSFSYGIKLNILKAYLRASWLFFRKNKNEIKFKIGGYSLIVPNPWLLRYLLKEIFILEEYAVELENDDIKIIDCGSNVGLSILYFKLKFPRAKVIGIEANPDTFKYLQQNTKQLENVTVINAMISDSSEEKGVFFTRGAGDVSASVDPLRGGAQRNEVNTVTLESIINNDTYDIMKVDIEGAEKIIFNPNLNLDYLKHVKKILIEYHHNIDNVANNDFSSFLSAFEKKGYMYNIQAKFDPVKPSHFQDIYLMFNLKS